MNRRLKNFISSFPANKIDAYLVTNDTDIRYLTHFPAQESWLLVFSKKVFYITDARYALEARQGIKGVSVCEHKESLAHAAISLLQKSHIKTVGFDDRHVSLALFKKLKKACPRGIKMVACQQLVDHQRCIKNAEEVGLIRQALNINKQAFHYLKRVIQPGVAEQEIFLKLDKYVRSKGVNFSFDPIIASGPNSCLPHAKITARKVRNDEPVLVDMGIEVGGYKSDLTRMFFFGRIPTLVQEVHALVQEAQKKAIGEIQPGIVASEVDQAARNYLRKHRLAKYFTHSLGHGVGLDIHESPSISSKSCTILKEGMVFTVEPGVYIPNKFGIRIEDMVFVTRDGCEVLSQ
ncbi:MAG: aminopeptidase P family protein [Candidatus Omnitrophica bacterium]|nr:aminopeptidase P family protein [Candidatus Omnitrophota bacterium]